MASADVVASATSVVVDADALASLFDVELVVVASVAVVHVVAGCVYAPY